MTSWELLESLQGKVIKSAGLVDSNHLNSEWSGEHLELILDSGFMIQLPYKNTIMKEDTNASS